MEQRHNTTASGWVIQLARSQPFVIANALVLAALLIALGARFAPAIQASLGRGAPSSPSAITITGPGMSTSTSVTAYILGDVAAPGVYTLTAGARVQALVAAAGGAFSDADLARVDLAARLADGQEVYVPRVGETIPLMLGGKVDINVASADDLHNALGLQRATATRIVAYRTAHGPFTAVSQLLLVPISQATYDRIKALVTA